MLGVNLTRGASGNNAGATLSAVTAGGPAANAGLQAGDVVTRVGDRVVTDTDSLIVAIRANRPGETVTIAYLRDGNPQSATVTLVAAK